MPVNPERDRYGMKRVYGIKSPHKRGMAGSARDAFERLLFVASL